MQQESLFPGMDTPQEAKPARRTYAMQIRATQYMIKESHGEPARVSRDVAAMFPEAARLPQEAFWVLTLDQKHREIDRHLVSLGTLTASLVHPREVYRPALIDGAAAVLFVHNHPSGDPTPSHEDRKLTTRLIEAGEILGIRVLDHVIIAREGHTSFAEKGLM